jgi:hypothetical protein
MDLTDEARSAAGQAAADAYRHWRNTTEVQNLSVLVAEVADAVARQVAPLIAAQALREAQLARSSFVIAEETQVHAFPEPGSAQAPCCGRNVLEMLGHRMTADPALVTCPGRERSQSEVDVTHFGAPAPKRWCTHGSVGHTTECYRWPGSP